MKESIKRPDRKIVGIGGIGCPCCTMYRRKLSKSMISRRARRRTTQTVRLESVSE